jgi:hypothetical protein
MNNQPLIIMLDRQTHLYAQQFASQQATPAKGKQVYLNTLAVCAVNNYLKCFSIPTNLSQSDCWHPGMRATFNVADLILPNFGKLECLWILPQQETVAISPEVREDRIGYLVVQLEEELQKGELLGFVPTQATSFARETISINQLQPLDFLFDTLDRLRGIQAPPLNGGVSPLQKQINFRQWLNGIFTPDWQPIATIMAGRIARSLTEHTKSTVEGRNQPLTKDASVNTISRGKAIALFDNDNSREEQVILIVKITESSADAIDFCVQIYPDGENHNLPTGLSIKIVDEAGETCLSAITEDNDDWMQLEFTCQPEANFTIELNLADININIIVSG